MSDPALLCAADGTLAQARRSAARWGRGTPAGALDGVPVAVKDVFLTRGWPTLKGSSSPIGISRGTSTSPRADLVGRAAATLGELGATVETAHPGFSDPLDIYEVLWSSGAAAATKDHGDEVLSHMDPGLRAIIEKGRRYSAVDYAEAARRRGELGAVMGRFHCDWDLLLTPTLPIPAFEAGRDVPVGWPDDRWPTWRPFNHPFNLTQQPAASMPCGLTAAGLPVGLQIVGPSLLPATVVC